MRFENLNKDYNFLEKASCLHDFKSYINPWNLLLLSYRKITCRYQTEIEIFHPSAYSLRGLKLSSSSAKARGPPPQRRRAGGLQAEP